jgi:hypothetical protein
MSQFQYVLQGTSIEKPQRLATFGLFKNGRPRISSIVQSKFSAEPDEPYGIYSVGSDLSNEPSAPCDYDPLKNVIPKYPIIIYNSKAKLKLHQDLVAKSEAKQNISRKRVPRKPDFIKINRQKIKAQMVTKSEGGTPQNGTPFGTSSCEQTLLNTQLSDMSSTTSNGSRSTYSSIKTDRSPKPRISPGNSLTRYSASATPTESAKSGRGIVYRSPVSSFSSNHGEVPYGHRKSTPRPGTSVKINTTRRNRPYLLQKQSQEYTETLSKLWYPKQTSSMAMNVSVTSADSIKHCDE